MTCLIRFLVFIGSVFCITVGLTVVGNFISGKDGLAAGMVIGFIVGIIVGVVLARKIEAE